MQVGGKCKIYHKCGMLAGNVSRNHTHKNSQLKMKSLLIQKHFASSSFYTAWTLPKIRKIIKRNCSRRTARIVK